jgi:multiple sugar transport system substrate-binding protein
MTAAVGFRGLTWDHPRGRRALEESALVFRDSHPAFQLEWDIHSLEGFESTPIAELAREYDVIVLDHPHLGDALDSRSLRSLDEVFEEADIDQWSRSSIGAAWRSYELDGRMWALPLDAATQVAVMSAGLNEDPPQTWDDVDDLADQTPVALSLAGPHAFLTFLSMCVAFGEEPGAEPDTNEFVPEEFGLLLLERMRRLAERAPAGAETLNPIAMLEAMSTGDSIGYCPLVFGYVNYARGGRVIFSDAPSGVPGGRRGSVLGGTGLALTRRNEPTPELLAYFRWLLSEQCQRVFIPNNEGQPGSSAAWDDAGLNREFRDFYRNTRQTIEQAWIRPRYAGYPRLQSTASAIVRDIAMGRRNARDGLADINRTFSSRLQSTGKV